MDIELVTCIIAETNKMCILIWPPDDKKQKQYIHNESKSVNKIVLQIEALRSEAMGRGKKTQ